MTKARVKAANSMRAVIYARYSSHNQRDVSIEQQFAACEKYAAERGYSVVDHYADRAISGTTDKRPSFQRMMHESATGAFDVVISWKSNRMGRNMMQAMVNQARLAELGVRCLYVEEDFDDTASGRFSLRTMMNVNQFYSENMAEDVRRGMMDNASKCMVNNLPPFGYRKGKDGKFEIVEEEAAIVREIYSRIVAGWSIYDIQTDLNLRGIKTRRGSEWKKQSFGKLLSNDKYIGVYRFADVVIEDGVPAILDKETFARVQAILRAKKKPRGSQRMNDEYLLTGKLFCGMCGAPMTAQTGTSKNGKKFNYYSCNRKRYEHTCEKKNEPQSSIEAAVIEAIHSELEDNQVIGWLVESYGKSLALAKKDTKKESLKGELAAVNKEIDNFLKAIGAGIFNEFTQQRMEELRLARKDIEEAIRLEEAADRLPSSEDFAGWLHSIREGDWSDRSFVREVIRLFVRAIYVFDDKITIHFNYGTDADLDYHGLAVDHTGDESEADVFSDSPKWGTRKRHLRKQVPFSMKSVFPAP